MIRKSSVVESRGAIWKGVFGRMDVLLVGFLNIADKGLPGYIVPRTLGGANQALQIGRAWERMTMWTGSLDGADRIKGRG